MPGTQVNMVRQTAFEDGAYVYKITATCVTRGTLNDVNIFLLKIADEGDPKDDAFVRVCEIADFTLYRTSRDQALSELEVYWRDSRATFSFTDVETANAAWQELSARINTLVEADDIYDNQFKTTETGATITYPTVAQSIVDTLKEAYELKKNAVTEAQAAYDLKVASCSGHEVKLNANALEYAQTEADLKALLAVQATLNAGLATYQSAHASLTASNNHIRYLSTSSDATEAQKDGIEAQLALDSATLTALSGQNGAMATALSGGLAACIARLQGKLSTLTQDKTAVLSNLNQCTAEKTRLQAQVTVAEEQRDLALQEVLVVCPDFTP